MTLPCNSSHISCERLIVGLAHANDQINGLVVGSIYHIYQVYIIAIIGAYMVPCANFILNQKTCISSSRQIR